MSVISSASAGGDMTITVPNTLVSGFTFWVFRNTNNIIVRITAGSIAWPSGNLTSTVTVANQFQVVCFVSDGSNLYVVSGIAPDPTYQKFTSGSANYTPTSAAVVRIKVRM